MDKKKTDRFQVTEMFGAKAGKDRFFTGMIKRWKDDKGNPFVFSRIVMPNGLLCSRAPDQRMLGENLDKICIMILDNGLHSQAGVTTKIFDTDFFLN
jgi:hypothetical protein